MGRSRLSRPGARQAGANRRIARVGRRNRDFDLHPPHLGVGKAKVRGAVTLVGGRVPTEASGGVTLETIRAIAETGVTFISVGRITQSAPAADIGLDFTSLD